jgi:transcription elongation factor Elf1
MSEKRQPQRLYRTVDVCDSCGARDSFRATGRRGNVTYLKCAECGRRATRLILWQDKPKP